VNELMWLIPALFAAACAGCGIGAVALRAFYVTVPPNKALVRIGSQVKVVRNSGTLVLPLLHRTKAVNLEAFSVPFYINDAITGDRLKVSADGSILVQVGRDDLDVLRAAESFPDSDVDLSSYTSRTLSTLIDDAFRTACIRYTYIELVTRRQEVSDDIRDLMDDEFAKLGLRVLSMSVSQLVQIGTWEI